MLYSILCYHSEEFVGSWTKEEDDAVIAKLLAVQEPFAKQGKLGPVVRLKPTATARTLRKHREPFTITDGPFAETKEAILGFYVVDCETEDEVMEFARELGRVNPGGSYEIRPIAFFAAGSEVSIND